MGIPIFAVILYFLIKWQIDAAAKRNEEMLISIRAGQQEQSDRAYKSKYDGWLEDEREYEKWKALK